MKWKWAISFFFCLFLICLAYCRDYQKTMYEIEKEQVDQMIQERVARNEELPQWYEPK